MRWMRMCQRSFALSVLAAAAATGAASAQVPAEIAAAPGETAVVTLHAEGAQVYECKAGSDGKLAWAFREPIATLVLDGKTVGRHYAGPNWEHMDGSAVVGKAAGNAPGKSASDIPWLKLEVTAHRGSGAFSGVSTPPTTSAIVVPSATPIVTHPKTTLQTNGAIDGADSTT